MPKSTRANTQTQGGDRSRTVSFVSLGCPKNLVDSEKMLGLLAESGIVPVSLGGDDPSFANADAVVVNTCGFLEASKEESLGVIKDAIAAKERGEVGRVVVAGCLVQRHRAKMLEWAPGIDALVGVFDRDKIVEAVLGDAAEAATAGDDAVAGNGGGKGERTTRANHGARRSREAPRAGADPKYWIAANALQAAKDRGIETTGLTVNGKDGQGIGYFEDDSTRLRLTPRHYAYLRVSEGCNQNCAFCTIPSIRGKMRSKPIDRVVAEARELANDGAFEFLLIGQDTTSYGDDVGAGLRRAPLGEARGVALPQAGSAPTGGPAPASQAPNAGTFAQLGGLPALLGSLHDALSDLGVDAWVRLMYAYPSNFDDAIIDAFAELCNRPGAKLIPYLDIPLQHASDRVLTLMRRHVTRHQQGDVIRKLRQRLPEMAVRTTFISGFPGETEDDHRQLLEFVGEMRFENVGVFEYSHEEGTVAGVMENDPKLAVAPEDKSRRRGEIMALQQKIVFERNAALAARFDENAPLKNGKATGVQVDVLIDAPLRSSGRATAGVSQGGKLYQGRTKAQAPQIDGVTFVQSRDKLSPGEVVRCTITGFSEYDLVARPTAELEKRVSLNVLR
ncbi:MAG: radical SAM protein [Planctomycetota bacterium]|nr:radical SAM protein [Planctomycetota bacterium]